MQIRGYEELNGWLKSITNHLYWSVSFTSEECLRVAAFSTLFNHVTDIHVHDGALERCLHPTNIQRKWLKPGMVEK